MKKSSVHVTLVISVIIALIVMALGGFMFYMVRSSTARALLARDIVRIEESRKSREKDLKSTYMDTAEQRAQLQSFFVNDTKVVPFIEALEAVGTQSGSTLTLSSIAADDLHGTAAGTIGKIRVHVDAVGSWSSVMRTLAQVETFPYQTVVENVRFDTSGLDSGTSKKAREWHISFDVQAKLIH